MNSSYLTEVLPDKTHVKGELYVITNTLNNHKYVGQTLTHRLNHTKYRPFGYLGRFADHVSEALNNTKKNQCVYLNNAIRKYGSDKFTCELIIRCELNELDKHEQEYIESFNTFYPNGYNLTKGGKTTEYIKVINNEELKPVKKNFKKNHSDVTKTRISAGLKKALQNVDLQKARSTTVMDQHAENKIKKFRDAGITFKKDEDLNKYIKQKNDTLGVTFSEVCVGTMKVKFYSKHETAAQSHNRAIDFLKKFVI